SFVRTLGGALGVGILGATLGFELAQRLDTERGAGIDVSAALRPETHASLSPQQLRVVQEALGLSLRDVFFQMSAVAALIIVCSIGLKSRKPAAAPQTEDDDSVSDSETEVATEVMSGH
ncbi:hypothetical protein ACYOEI_16375, partial [Singulisphaera rosea]